MRKVLFPAVLICTLTLLSCNGNKEKETSTKDSTKTGERDSLNKDAKNLPVPKADTNFELKTNVSQTAAKGITVILEDGKKLTLDKYPQYYDYGQGDDSQAIMDDNVRDSSIRSLIDIDQDKAPELITQYFSGGAHCCYVSDIFTKVSENTYKRICHYPGEISLAKNVVILYFFEDLGYFNACYACDIESEIKWPVDVPRNIKLELKNGAFAYPAKDDKINEGIEANLNALKARGIPNIKKGDDMDDGTRKAYAFLMVTYYFNTDRDLAKTKELFFKYYDNSDKNKIWKQLEEYLTSKTAEIKNKIKH